MKVVRVTVHIEGEVLVEPEVPLFCVPALRWLTHKLGGTFVVGQVRDHRSTKDAA